MKIRFLLAILALVFATGCSKKKRETPPVDPEEMKRKLAPYILDQEPEIAHKSEVKLGEHVSLLGYAIEPAEPLKPGQKAKLTFYWRTTGKVEGGYKLFTWFLDASGEKLFQIEKDAPLRQDKKTRKGGLAISAWEPGKVYVDQQTFRVPKARTETIQVVTGMYNKEGRLPVTGGEKDSQDRAIVASFKLLPADGKPRVPALPSISLDRLEKSDKIKLDGKLDEPAWQAAPLLGPLVDIQAQVQGKPSAVGGSAHLLWDDTNLYVGVEVTDAAIEGGFPKTAKDPHLFTKDAVELLLEPDDADKGYYELALGPQNLVFDSEIAEPDAPKPDGPFGKEEWASKAKSAVVLDGTLDKADDTDKGYTVEAQIPWKSFAKAKKTPPALGDTWRLNLAVTKEGTGVAWAPILGTEDFHKVPRFGKVRFTAKGWTPPVESVDGGAPIVDGGATTPDGGSAAPAVSASGAAVKPTSAPKVAPGAAPASSAQ